MAVRKRFRARGEQVVIGAGTMLLLEVVYRLHLLTDPAIIARES